MPHGRGPSGHAVVGARRVRPCRRRRAVLAGWETGLVTLQPEPALAVYHRLAAHIGEVSLGGARAIDATHVVDLVVYPDSVSAVFRRWAVSRVDDGLIVRQYAGPLRVRVGRWPPWQNTVVWVRQDQTLAMVLVSARTRRKLRAILTASGFGIKEDRISLAHGRTRYEP